MKVLLVANINSTHTKKWALALKEKNVQVALFSLNMDVLHERWYDALDQVYFPHKNKIFIFKYVYLFFQLKKEIKKFAPDVIHSHFITNYSLIANLTGFKNHMITAWGSDVFHFPKKNFLTRFIIKYNLSKAKSILSTSHAMAKEMALYTGKPVHVVPFGIDFGQFSFRQETKDFPRKFNICYFKKIEPVYAPDILIKAFSIVIKKLPEHDLTLTLAGDGSEMESMMSLSKQLNIQDKIVFLGWVSPTGVPDLLKHADLCVYLSRRESFGVALLEAMAAKVPLVVSRAVGFVEVAGSANTVLFVDFDNIEQTAEQIIRLIVDQKLYKSMTQSSYEHARKNYDLEVNITEQIKLYMQMLKKPNKAYQN